jgi:hypothetical protein
LKKFLIAAVLGFSSSYVVAEEVPDFNSVLENFHTPTTHQCNSCKEDVSCDVKGPREDSLKLLPKDWGLEASGADLIKQDPFIKSLSYQYKLGIVDTGLKLNNNTEAGDRMRIDSPESDEAGHGTHVIGIASSESHGVNPHMPSKMFKVANSASGSVNSADLLNALQSAINDPKIKVINMSWSFTEQPKTVDLVKEATEKGKWIVFAAGNENQVANYQTAGHQQFSSNPSFFKVGSSNYFGAPSAFSNFGPDVTIYAPGSAINSLYNNYNENFTETQKSIMLNGTSMAAPHFAAVLSTLANIAPDLKSIEMQELFKQTAIVKGTKTRKFPFLNAYLAFEVLKDSKECLKAKTAKICFANSIAKFKKLPQPQKPVSTTCESKKKYYEDLRKYYFLTKGNDSSVKGIAELFKDEALPIAEMYIFQNNQNNKAILKQVSSANIPGIYKRERERVVEFLDGKLSGTSSTIPPRTTSAPPSNGKQPIDLLLPIVENLPEYIKLCQKAINNDSSVSMKCFFFLTESPRRFKEAFMTYLEKLSPPTANALLLGALDSHYDDIFNDRMKKLYLKGLQECHPKSTCNGSDAEEFLKVELLTPSEKANFARSFLKRITDNEFPISETNNLRPLLETYVSMDDESQSLEEKSFSLKKNLLKSTNNTLLAYHLQMSSQEDEPKEFTLLRYLALRASMEVPTQDFSTNIDSMLAIYSKSHSNRDIHQGVPEYLKKIASSSSAGSLIKALKKPKNFVELMKWKNSNLISLMLKSEKITKEEKQDLLKIVKDMLLTQNLYQAEYDILNSNQDIPEIKLFIEELRTEEGQKKYPKLSQTVLGWSTNNSVVTPDFKALIKLNRKHPPRWILNVNPELSLQDPDGQRLVRQNFSDAMMNPKPDINFTSFISNLNMKSCEAYCELLINTLPELIKKNLINLEGLTELMKKLVIHKGSDKKLITKVIGTLQNLIHDDSFLWRANFNEISSRKEVEAWEEETGETIKRGASFLVESFVILTNSKAGREILTGHPVWKDLSKFEQETMNVDFIPRWSLGEPSKDRISIPPELKKFYVTKIDPIIKSGNIYKLNKIQPMIEADGELAKVALEFMKKSGTDSNPYKTTLGHLITAYVSSHQDQAPEFLKLVKGSGLKIEAGNVMSTSEFLLEDIINGYIDYEN